MSAGIAAVVATAAMSIGAIARAAGLPPFVAFVAYAVALPVLVLAAARRTGPRPDVAPPSPRWLVPAVAAALFGYVAVAAVPLAGTRYHSDAVVAAHGAARLLLEGRHPY